MPKLRSKRKRKASGGAGHVDWSGSANKGATRINIALTVVAALAAIAAGVYGYGQFRNSGAFDALVADGQGRLGGVVNKTNFGRRHLDPGQVPAYSESFPTSGPHPLNWAEPGFYDTRIPEGPLVHALEHGNIVIYYDEQSDDVIATLKDWTDLFGGKWDGLIVTPMTGLGQEVVLTAWTKELRLGSFDPVAAAAFIDAYRGRGPEHPVR